MYDCLDIPKGDEILVRIGVGSSLALREALSPHPESNVPLLVKDTILKLSVNLSNPPMLMLRPWPSSSRAVLSSLYSLAAGYCLVVLQRQVPMPALMVRLIDKYYPSPQVFIAYNILHYTLIELLPSCAVSNRLVEVGINVELIEEMMVGDIHAQAERMRSTVE